MQTTSTVSRFGIAVLSAVSATLILASTAIVACSSALPNSAGDSSCAALTACCGTLPAQTTQSCQALAQAAKTSASGSSCASVLQGYQSDGYCGGGGDGGAPGAVDAGVPACVFTGTCDAGSNSSPGTKQCTLVGSCANGLTYSTCTQTAAGGACSASVVFSDGAEMGCASCTDCAAATASATIRCNQQPQPIVDAAPPPPVDSGPSCGTTPVLHPEVAPGVYCPFTAAGAVHCAAGQDCCEAPAGMGTSTCVAAGTGCPIVGSVKWECSDPLDCTGTDAGAVCCAVGGTTTLDPVCSYYRGSGFTGSVCAASCGAGQVQICSAANDPCVSPKTCTPFKVAGYVMGTCL